MKNYIGISTEELKPLIDRLNKLLASYEVFYQNLRGFHWNIKGKHFFKLHAKFEEYYNLVNERIDEIAERIKTLGGTPYHTFTDFLKYSTIAEKDNLTDESSTIEETIKGFQELLKQERELIKLASEYNDEGTAAMISDFVRETEKILWMLGSMTE